MLRIQSSRNRARHVGGLAVVCWSLCLVVGCGGDCIPATGRVTVDGAPMQKGVIKFVPAPGVHGPEVAADVIDGRFAFDTTNGPVAGEYKVQIFLDQPLPAGLDDPEKYVQLGGPQGKVAAPPNPVHARFNVQTTLTAKVTPESHSEFQFAVTTAKPSR